VTISFFLLALLMLALALAIILPPLLRSGGRATKPAAQARRKLAALNLARDEGVLSEAEYQAKRALLGDELLGGLDSTRQPSRNALALALAIALLLPASAILLYRYVGEPRALDASAIANPEQAPADHGENIDAAISGLVSKLKQNPDDAEGWALLGRAYKATQRFAESRDAFKHAYALAPKDADVGVEYAEAQVLSSDDRHIAGEPRKLLDQAVQADPRNQRGLWLLGIAESQDGNYAAAIADWQRLLAVLPKDSDVAISVQKQIARAEAQRDGKPLPADDEQPATAATAPAPASAPSATPAESTGPQLTVKVSLAPRLNAMVAAGDTVFVFAKAANGPPMPLAIQRLHAGELPTTVTLTDGMGMLPTMKLSQFPQVIIGARISKSGNAIAQSGDLQTLSKPLDVATNKAPIELIIDQVVP
jgi:cytochrome c-type biogenesis protein CcmH